MNIAVNTRLLLSNKMEGIGWFAFETLKRITQQHPEHHFIFLFDRPFSDEFIFSQNITPVVVFPPTRHPLLWYLWFEWAVPPILKKHNADLFFSPDGWLSLRTSVKSINVIHDLNFEHFPEYLPFHVKLYYHYFFQRFAKKAERIATVSEFTKQDIINTYGINPSNIDVVYNGVNELFQPLSFSEKEKTKSEFSHSSPYFVFVGLIHPRKNITNLLLAFEEFKKSHSSDLNLIIIGEKKWWTKDMEEVYSSMQFKDKVIFTGRLSSVEIRNVIASALAMLYVSYFEGFGIPILEAMQCDVPVITSNITSMPEVAKDAALLVDPFSVDSIKEAMLKIVKDESLRNTLIEKGRERRKAFSWDKTTDLLWKSIEKTLES